MQKSIEYVRQTGKIAEGTMCYTGDLLSPDEHKYTLDYYKTLAGQLVDAGEIDGIGWLDYLKPQAAYELIGELKSKYDVPFTCIRMTRLAMGLQPTFRLPEPVLRG